MSHLKFSEPGKINMYFLAGNQIVELEEVGPEMQFRNWCMGTVKEQGMLYLLQCAVLIYE